MCQADGTVFDWYLTGHHLHCPDCKVHLTDLGKCPKCGKGCDPTKRYPTCEKILADRLKTTEAELAITQQALEGIQSFVNSPTVPEWIRNVINARIRPWTRLHPHEPGSKRR